ncbi:hypothetical protein, partial [Nocardioides malaquae]|uniref:hypothetical protein n=1 Tax=Nocardioides malaquae TaxID=2773426 RepID=UPI001D0D3260
QETTGTVMMVWKGKIGDRNKIKIKKEQGYLLLNHQAPMAHLLSLPLTPFEETRGRKMIEK